MQEASRPVPKRCTGHCCRGFALERSYAEIQEEYRKWKVDPKSADILQVEIIAPMIIPLSSNDRFREYTYACKNLGANGDCTIYERRPQMCRDFPDERGCRFWKCTAQESIYKDLGLWRKVLRWWKWKRESRR